MILRRRGRVLALALAACLGFAGLSALGGCAVNPATGRASFTALMSPAAEKQVGAAEHPKLVAAFGGLYDDPALQRYVESLGRLVQSVSEEPAPPYSFVILDSPVVNAFALPGGYIHLSRGLLALANDEAELAGVIAHEIAHVTARHAAERYSHATLARLGSALLERAAEGPAAERLGRLAADLYVQGYSREQELEADQLAVRYLARAGFDATAMASFLDAMGNADALERRIAGRDGAPPLASLFSSHPRTADRVYAAARAAGTGGARDRAVYLRQIDCLAYGESEAEGTPPRRLRVVAVGADDTAESLARRMAFRDHRLERFLVLNGLAPGAQLEPGLLVKIVTR